MKSKPYDVVLLPEIALREKFIETSTALESLGTHFTLAENTFFPHLSLYMLQLNETGLANACQLLESAAAEIKIEEVEAKDFHYEHEYLDIEFKKTENLTQLQNKIIELLNPIRDGLREKDTVRLLNAVGEERSNLLTYGYRSVSSMFSPHVTFTRFKNNQKPLIEQLPPINSFSGRFVAMGIFEMGDNGTCIQKVKIWDL